MLGGLGVPGGTHVGAVCFSTLSCSETPSSSDGSQVCAPRLFPIVTAGRGPRTGKSPCGSSQVAGVRHVPGTAQPPQSVLGRLRCPKAGLSLRLWPRAAAHVSVRLPVPGLPYKWDPQEVAFPVPGFFHAAPRSQGPSRL